MNRQISLSPEADAVIDRLRTAHSIWIALGVSVCIGAAVEAYRSDDYLVIKIVCAFLGFIYSGIVFTDYLAERRAAWQWHEATLEAYRAKHCGVSLVAVKQSAPSEPQDGGETPTPQFIDLVWTYHRNNNAIPAVRDSSFAVAGINEARVQKMFTRLVTWGAIVGRVKGGSPGEFAPGWTIHTTRKAMIAEKPAYAPAVDKPNGDST